MVRGSSGKTPKSSVYRGVTLFRPTGKWRAQVWPVPSVRVRVSPVAAPIRHLRFQVPPALLLCYQYYPTYIAALKLK